MTAVLTGQGFKSAGPGNRYALWPTAISTHEASWDHHTWSAVEPIDRIFFSGAGGPSANCLEER